jgi:hypothetical protein
MRRSSTSRSIGNRASFQSDVKDDKDVNGDRSYFPGQSEPSESDAFGREEELEQERRKSIADSHYEKYVTEQLSRMQTDESVAVYEDEFEAQLD